MHYLIKIAFIGFALYSIFIGMYKFIYYDQIENEYQELHSFTLSISLPAESRDITYERREKILHSYERLTFKSEIKKEQVIGKLEKDLLSKGFCRKKEPGNLLTYVKGDWQVNLSYFPQKMYVVIIYRDDWKWRMGI